jgi:uncharacterized membrane protein YkvA (DUF1232 family)
MTELLVAAAIVLVAYAAFIGALWAAGRRVDAAALVRLVPDCLVLVRRLATDPRVPRRVRWMLAGLGLYLAFPLDLVPDVIPVAGQLDDVILTGLVLRAVIRSAGPELVAERWPGSPRGLEIVQRVAGARVDRALR